MQTPSLHACMCACRAVVVVVATVRGLASEAVVDGRLCLLLLLVVVVLKASAAYYLSALQQPGNDGSWCAEASVHGCFTDL